MNCSARELGLGNDHAGIMVAARRCPWACRSPSTWDVRYGARLGITPNRPDCLSMVGMAREVGAIYDRDTHVECPDRTRRLGARRPTSSSLAIAARAGQPLRGTHRAQREGRALARVDGPPPDRAGVRPTTTSWTSPTT